MCGLKKDKTKYWGCSNCVNKDKCDRNTKKYKNFCYEWKREVKQ